MQAIKPGACFRAALGLALAAGLAAAGPPEAGKPKRLTVENRLAIVRVLASEYATTRQPLPASQKAGEALVVTPAATPAGAGEIQEDKLRDVLAKRGAAAHSGEIVQVTAIEFKSSGILFEINGGGPKKKKWYERIQVGGGVGGEGPSVQATPPPPPPGQEPGVPVIGSWILLDFPDYIPDLNPTEVKTLLAGVLDFNTRSPVTPWIETIPEEFREAIKEKKAKVGMDREMVLAALGRPQSKVREMKDGVEREDWIYGNPPFVTFVTFVGDKVVEVKEFK